MKKTVKQWCLHEGFNWYGPGRHGNCAYDYVIHFGRGRKAFFKTVHGPSRSTRRFQTRNAEFLVFPVFSQVIGRKEMTHTQFKSVLGWVEQCLSGDMREYDE